MLNAITQWFAERNTFWLTYLAWGILSVALLSAAFYVSHRLLLKRKRALVVKYFQRFFPQIVMSVLLFFLLYPLYLTGGINPEMTLPEQTGASFLVAMYHTLRFFVMEGDIHETLMALERIRITDEVIYNVYRVALSALFFGAPFLAITAIMSVFQNIRSGFKYFFSFGSVHVFSELNEKSFALAESISEGNRLFRKHIVVFTDVLKPDNELQYDLQESAENRGFICFRNDLESIHYRVSLSLLRNSLSFYLINDDETEKIRHASFVLKNYNARNVKLYIISDKVQSKLYLAVKDNDTGTKRGSFQSVVRVDEIQSLIYHDLHKNGMRLFETAKNFDANKEKNADTRKITAFSDRIVIRAVIVGFGRYGREMFKALLWYCQMPGYALELHVIDSEKKLRERLNRDFPELMETCLEKKDEPGSSKHFGDALYSVNPQSGVDVNTEEFDKALESIVAPTFVFVALGSDEENIQASIRVREFYRKKQVDPDIETVVYDSNVAERMNYRWPLGGGVEAAYYLFTGKPMGNPRDIYVQKTDMSPSFAALFERFGDFDDLLDQSWSMAKRKPRHTVSFSYRINVRKLYEPCTTDHPDEIQAIAEEIVTHDAKPCAVKNKNGAAPPDGGCSVDVWEENDVVVLRVSLFSEKLTDRPTRKAVYDKAKEAFGKAKNATHTHNGGVQNFKRQPYRIHMIGDLERFYRFEIIINDELRKAGKGVDGRWRRANLRSAGINRRVYEFLANGGRFDQSTLVEPESSSGIYLNVLHLKGLYDESVDVELTDTETYQLKEIPYKEKKGGKEFKRLELTRLDLPGGPVHVRNDHRNFYPIILNVFETCKKELAYFMKAVPMRETANFRPTQAYRELVDSMSALSACLQNKRIEQIRSFETMMDHHAIPFIREYLSIRKAVFDTFKKESAVFDERHIVLVDDGETNTLVDYSFMGARKIEGAENGDASFPQEKDRSERWCFRLPRVFTKKDGKATADASCEKKQEPTCENDEKCGISSVKCLTCLIKECNKIIGDKDTDDGAYDRHEYNQRSSITKYMHEVLRYRLLRCGYLDDEVSRACADPNFFYFERRSDSPDKSKVYCSKLARAIQMDPETIMDLELKKALCTVEHIRWNAYMRTEGYSFSMKRDDMAKTHPDMVQVQYLSMEDIRKDV